jgi:hypothetical protein
LSRSSRVLINVLSAVIFVLNLIALALIPVLERTLIFAVIRNSLPAVDKETEPDIAAAMNRTLIAFTDRELVTAILLSALDSFFIEAETSADPEISDAALANLVELLTTLLSIEIEHCECAIFIANVSTRQELLITISAFLTLVPTVTVALRMSVI